MELNAEIIKNMLPHRAPWGHKGTFGKVYCLCGSVGFTGAPVFAARAAVRTGCGLAYLGVPEPVWEVVAKKCDEAMPFPFPAQQGKLALSGEDALRRAIAPCDAFLMGCGLGRSEESDQLLRNLLDVEKPLVLDADGINALPGHIDKLDGRKSPTVLTPHEGEFARIGDLSAGRETSAADFAKTHGVYLVLKGHRTVIAAPDGRLAVNTTGNSGMAKGGSGDVLSGMLVSLLGQGMAPFEAACTAVYLHGLCGDLAAAEKTERAMTPTDMIEKISDAYKIIEG